MDSVAIGVDIGGSQVKLVAVDRERRVHRRETAATLAGGTQPEAIVNTIISATRKVAEGLPSGTRVEGYGFSVPCYTEGEDWALGEVTNLPSLEGFPLRPPLAAAFGEHIATTYDTNAAGLAEFLWGAGAGCTRMFFMGIGTGISASFFTAEDGMVSYTFATLGDTGHLVVAPESGVECLCGGHGCLEAVAAAPAIRTRALEAARAGESALLAEMLARRGDLSARDTGEAAAAGDPAARAIFEQTGRYLGIALASYLHIFAPRRIVLGGGVGLAGEALHGPLRRTFAELASPWYLKRFEGIVPSHFGLEAGAVGSACQVFYPDVVHHRESPEG
jgi:glucokinase